MKIMDEPQKNLLGADHNANVGGAPVPPPMPPKIFSSLPSSLGAGNPASRPPFASTGIPPRPINVPPPLPSMPNMSNNAPKPFFPPAPSIPSRPVATPMESKTPAPSAPMVNIRSMSSDAQTLKESGGIAPKPQTIKLETLEDNMPMLTPMTNNQLPSGEVASSGHRVLNVILEVILVFVVAVVLGFVGYYFVYPMIFDDKLALAPVVVKPSVAPVVVSPKSEVALTHKTLFTKPVSEQATVSLSDLTAIDIIEALQTEARRVAVAGTLREINLQKGGALIKFSQYLNALLPDVSVTDIASVAEEDFTGFLYYDDKGIWPGYVVKIKNGANSTQIANWVTKFENADVSKLYVSDPGSMDSFKDGPYKNAPVRYVKFTKPGASLNYGIFGETLVIATSFNALKAAVAALGL